MRSVKTVLSLVLTSLLAGCIPVGTIHPLFTEKEVVFDPGILGTWNSQDDEDGHWTVSQAGNQAYQFTFTAATEDSSLTYDVRLVRLRNLLFVDGLLREVRDKGEDGLAIGTVPAHIFGRIYIEGDNLRLAMLDDEWLKKAIAENRVKIGHETMGDTIVLTASTAELQQFALKYAENKDAFAVDLKLARRK